MDMSGAVYIRHGGAGKIRHGVGCLSMTKQVKSHRSFSNPQIGVDIPLVQLHRGPIGKGVHYHMKATCM